MILDDNEYPTEIAGIRTAGELMEALQVFYNTHPSFRTTVLQSGPFSICYTVDDGPGAEPLLILDMFS